MFIDQAKIRVIAGNGGHGVVSFRREKYVPKGGPDGGDGGKGGDVIVQANSHLHTLLDFRYKRIFKAPSGRHGQGAKKTGRSGKNIVIKVPCGTLIKDAVTGEILADLIDDKQQVVVAKGGKGGRGNWHFATPTKKAPRFAEEGKTGETREIVLELKLIADVGLVGLPNAGKSTLLSRLSTAHPKIADYPFTTLTPNLGIVKFKEQHSYVLADIPGLIEGAHQGKGLGLNFLRHIERTRVLAFLIEIISDNIFDTFEVLRNELGKYNSRLLTRPAILILTKVDLADENDLKKLDQLKNFTIPVHKISAVTGEGVGELNEKFWDLLIEQNKQ